MALDEALRTFDPMVIERDAKEATREAAVELVVVDAVPVPEDEDEDVELIELCVLRLLGFNVVPQLLWILTVFLAGVFEAGLRG